MLDTRRAAALHACSPLLKSGMCTSSSTGLREGDRSQEDDHANVLFGLVALATTRHSHLPGAYYAHCRAGMWAARHVSHCGLLCSCRRSSWIAHGEWRDAAITSDTDMGVLQESRLQAISTNQYINLFTSSHHRHPSLHVLSDYLSVLRCTRAAQTRIQHVLYLRRN